nr:MAG TPA: hypothetical protein [Caudoviricetes sp.]
MRKPENIRGEQIGNINQRRPKRNRRPCISGTRTAETRRKGNRTCYRWAKN